MSTTPQSMRKTWEVDMKNTLVAAVFGAILAVPAVADPVFGTWKTIPDDNGNYGHI